jgi:hypothetical protein
MVALLFFLLRLLFSPFRSISRLEAENAALRRQLIVLQRQVRGRVQFTNSDRLFFLQLYRWFPSIVKAMTTIRPETLVRWHRAGFRRYWRWKSRNLGGRPPIDAGLRGLIRRMSIENMLWGAPRIQGELLKLGFAVAQSTVAKYMASTDGPSGQSWGTFLRNHLPQIAVCAENLVRLIWSREMLWRLPRWLGIKNIKPDLAFHRGYFRFNPKNECQCFGIAPKGGVEHPYHYRFTASDQSRLSILLNFEFSIQDFVEEGHQILSAPWSSSGISTLARFPTGREWRTPLSDLVTPRMARERLGHR